MAQLLNEYYDFNLVLEITIKEIYHYRNSYWQVIDEELLKCALTEMFIKTGEPFNPLRIQRSMNENGKPYLKTHTAKGVRTNIEINIETSYDWLSNKKGSR